MESFDEKLNSHIDKVLQLQNSEREKMLSLDDLKELDLSLGVTEEEWEKMMKKAEKEVELSQNHFDYKNYTEAYKTAESAISINPYLTEAQMIMASSALKIYETEDDDDYLLKAELHAKDVLIQVPTEKRAIELLAVLSKYKKSEKEQKSKFLKIGIASLIGLTLIIVVIFWPREEKPKEIDQSLKYELIEAEENVNSKWAQVENVISRRDKLIPQLMEAVETGDDTIDELKKEIDTLKEEITSADDEKKIELQALLQDRYQKLTGIISKTYKDENIATLMIQIEGSYNRIAVEGKRYNDAVKNYNILVKKHSEGFDEFKTKPYFKGQ